MKNELLYDIALSYDQSLTPIEKTSLFLKYGSSKKILSLNINTIKNILGRNWTGKRFHKDSFINKAKNVMKYIEKSGINLLRFDNRNFPYGLKKIPDFPFLIYYKGNLNFDYEKSISIVGTRIPDAEGLNNCIKLTEDLTNNGYTIISGLAKGIDSCSHLHCINNKGKTIAVLGCGIDRIYPSINKELGGNILKSGGAIISEYPPGIKPAKWNFPKRNRLIVGLSRGVIIVQAPERSGSLISAMLAADYNRELFVIKPDKNKNIEKGNLSLIMIGAMPITSPLDVYNELNYFS